MTNFGWEYVWHCHILGHEENDMMRPIVFNGGATAADHADDHGLSTTSGTAAGGTSVTINGANFNTANLQVAHRRCSGSSREPHK